MSAKRKVSKKPSAQVPNLSESGKGKGTPKPRGGGKKQGRRGAAQAKRRA
jgi:hypothetical protein